MTLNIAVIPGDGIGKEIVPEGLKVLDRVLADKGIDYSTTHFNLGAERWHATGDTLTDEDLEAIKPPCPPASSSAGCSSSCASLLITT